MYDTIIIGAGPAGLSSALYASRAGLKTLVMAGSELGGQAMDTVLVDNYPGAPLEFTGSQLIDNLKTQANYFGAEIKKEQVRHLEKVNDKSSITSPASPISTSTPIYQVQTATDSYQAKTLIIATGATRRRLGLPLENQLIGRGLSFCATCDGPFFRQKDIAVIGGGSVALEEALFLASLANQIHLIHRRDQFSAPDQKQIAQILAHPQITVHFQTTVSAYLTDEKQKKLTGLELTNTQTKAAETLTVSGVFLAIGTVPNSQLFIDQLGIQHDAQGYLQTNFSVSSTSTSSHADSNSAVSQAQTATNLPGVFVAGDVADPLYKQLTTATATGAQAALDVRRFLLEI